METKIVYESLDDILKPKTKEQLLKDINNIDANDALISSIDLNFLEGVMLALENGANINLMFFPNQTPLDLALRKKR